MKKLLIVTVYIIVFCWSGDCQSINFNPSFSVVLDTSKASAVLNQCSRSVPKNIKGFWTPSKDDIKILERNFGNITKIYSKECCVGNSKIDSLHRFGFQYLGVIIGGKKLIYINAFPFDEIIHLKESNFDPSKAPIVVCDGGSYFWGALFDPQTKQFRSLSFNGYG